ncbi:synaptic vesicle glycoprotein 2B-like [Sitodiplosis mosellana]|uniref:synaptic vesicle glycoprotein 2B-like n=1 Tax=Sitodiplosis mosellana TaxID=263140 RepID=UPI002443F367|nr:synaptic vesicle glycoprotein 2B-like [Sitodiplosis mosellana]
MCQKNNLRDAENGCGEPKLSNDLPPKKKTIYMEEAITKTKFGLFNYYIIFVSGIILYAVGLETCAILYVIPVSTCDLSLTTNQKGILGAATFAGIICSSHLWGFLADTKGRRRVILPSLMAAVAMSVVCSFIQNFYIFTALRFLNGFFMSCASGTIYAYLGEFHNNIHRSRAIMGAAIIYGISCMMIPITAWFFINQDWQFQVPYIGLTYKPWRLFVVACAIPGFISVLALTLLPESPKFLLSQGNKEAAYQILQKMNRWNNGEKCELELFEIREETDSIEKRQRYLDNKNSRFPLLKSVWDQTAPLFKPPYLKSTILICTIQFGIYSTSTGFFMFFAEVLNKMSANLDNFYDQRISMCDAINMKPVNMSAIEYDVVNDEVCIEKLELSTLENGIVLEIAFGLGHILVGLLINKVGKFPIIFFILCTTGLSGIGCMLTDIPALQISLFLSLLSSGVAANVVSSATVELYPTTLRAMALCISLMFARFGGVAGSNTAAFLLDNHCEAAFYLSGSVVTAMGLLAFFIPNIHKKVSNAAIEETRNDPRLSLVSFRGSVKSF